MSFSLEQFARRLTDAAEAVADAETVKKVRGRVSELLGDLPDTAVQGINRVMRTARDGVSSLQGIFTETNQSETSVINASGILQQDQLRGAMVDDAAIVAAANGMRLQQYCPDVVHRGDRRGMESAFGLSVDYQVLIFHSVTLAMAALHSRGMIHQVAGMGKGIAVPRSAAVPVGEGRLLPDALGALMPQGPTGIVEIGSVGQVSDGDWPAQHAACMVSDHRGGLGDVQAPGAPVPLILYAPQVVLHRHSFADEIVLATLDELLAGHQVNESGERKETGFGAPAAVVFPGDGLLGGPCCGVLVIRRALAGQLFDSTTQSLFAASEPIQQAVQISATRVRQGGLEDPTPVMAGLQTHIDNLRHRAERLATRLSALSGVESVGVTDQPARIVAFGEGCLPSRQVVVQGRDAKPWHDQLLRTSPGVFTSLSENGLVIDLRFVDAAQDRQLGDLLCADA